MSAERPDPTSITDRAELAAGLRALREMSRVTYRELVERSGGLQGTVSGWFSGHHVPVRASADMFDRVLLALGVEDKDERDRWWEAVGRVRSAPGRKQAGRATPPYKGLESFDVADADWFFGRTDVVQLLQDRVRRVATEGGGVVVVLGASGSGKSSVLRAGLARTLGDAHVRSGIADIRTFTGVADGEDVVVFDQIEELWTAASSTERKAFLDVVSQRVVSGAVVVVGLRADFYQNAIGEEVLRRGLVDNPIVLARLRPDQLREVIVEPARKAGMTVDDALLRLLLSELEPSGLIYAHDQGALPLLSHALLATWQSASGSSMTVDDYYSTGGLAGAVQQTAEKVFDALTPRQQDEAQRIFVRLVNIDGEVLTRRRVARIELFRGAGTDDDTELVIESFTSSRLLTVEEETVSVTHEVLLTAWDRLRGWIDDDRQWHLAHRRLTEAAVLWEDNGRDATNVLTAARLASLQESLDEGSRDDDLNSVEREYLEASRSRIELEGTSTRRRRRIFEGLTAALAVATVLAVVLAGVAFSARADAESRRIDAEAALSGQLAGTAERLRSSDPGLAAYLALASYETNPTLAARSALLDSSAIHSPVRLQGVPGEARSTVDSTGRLVATAGADGIVRLFAIADGPARQVGVVESEETGSAVALDFAPADPIIVVGGSAGTTLWDVRNVDSPVELARVGDDATTSKSAVFSPDGTSLGVVSPTGAVSIWDVSDPASPTRSVDLTSVSTVNAIAFSPDGTLLATVGTARTIQLWSTTSYAVPLSTTLTDGTTYDHLSVEFSPDGRSLAAGTTGREVARWTIADGKPTISEPLTGFTSYVNDVAFSHDGSELAAVSSDNSIRTWDVATGVPRETLPGSSVGMSVVYSPDDSRLITAGQDGITKLWPRPGPVMSGQTDTVFINPIDGSGTTLVAGVGAQGDGLRVWDVTDPVRPVAAGRNLIATTEDPLTGAAAMSWDGRLVAGGTATGGFQLWDVSDVSDPVPVGGPHPAVDSLVAALSFTRAGNVLAVSPQNTTDIAVFDVSDPARPVLLSGFDVGDNPQVMTFDPTGQILAIPTLADDIQLWDLSDPRSPTFVTALEGFDDDGYTVAFSQDGRILAGASADASIRLWDVSDLRTPKHIARITGPTDAVYSLAFDSGGTRLAAGVGQSMWIFDVSDPSSPKPYATLTAYGNRVNDAVFSSDGSAVFGGGPEHVLRVWRTDPEDVKRRLCDAGGMTVTPEEWAQYLPGSDYRELC